MQNHTESLREEWHEWPIHHDPTRFHRDSANLESDYSGTLVALDHPVPADIDFNLFLREGGEVLFENRDVKVNAMRFEQGEIRFFFSFKKYTKDQEEVISKVESIASEDSITFLFNTSDDYEMTFTIGVDEIANHFIDAFAMNKIQHPKRKSLMPLIVLALLAISAAIGANLSSNGETNNTRNRVAPIAVPPAAAQRINRTIEVESQLPRRPLILQ